MKRRELWLWLAWAAAVVAVLWLFPTFGGGP